MIAKRADSMSLRLRPCTLRRALPFVREVHRRLPKIQGAMWAVSVRSGLEIVGVALVGHRARKATWLYANLCFAMPSLDWRVSKGARLDEGFHSSAERNAARAQGVRAVERLGHIERLATPLPFRDLLMSIARTAHRAAA